MNRPPAITVMWYCWCFFWGFLAAGCFALETLADILRLFQ